MTSAVGSCTAARPRKTSAMWYVSSGTYHMVRDRVWVWVRVRVRVRVRLRVMWYVSSGTTWSKGSQLSVTSSRVYLGRVRARFVMAEVRVGVT
jgi:hypothetical protein